MDIEKKKILTGVLTEERMQPLLKYLEREDVTDVDWNGSDLWIKNIDNEKIRIAPEEHGITAEYIAKTTQHIANSVTKKINKDSPELEAETDNYRITALHESVAVSGRCLCIRKTTKKARLNYEKLIEENYCSREILNLLINCWHAGFNIVVGGEPGVGKTEFAKYLSLFISNSERVITIEDVLEWHYKELKRNADGIELQIKPEFDYTAALKRSVRLNPDRLMLSETRSVEVKYLVEGWSTGVKGISTIHTDSAKKIPDRILNMMPSRNEAERLENDVYDNLDIGILISKQFFENSKKQRFIDEVCFFYREDGMNKSLEMVENGKLLDVKIPDCKLKKLRKKGIENPYEIESRIKDMEINL